MKSYPDAAFSVDKPVGFGVQLHISIINSNIFCLILCSCALVTSFFGFFVIISIFHLFQLRVFFFLVHLRRLGGSNIAAVSWSWNLMKGVSSETPNSFKAVTLLHCWHPCHTWWQQLPVLHFGRHQEITSILPLVLLWILLVASTFYRDHGAWRLGHDFAILLVLPWLPRPSMPSI